MKKIFFLLIVISTITINYSCKSKSDKSSIENSSEDDIYGNYSDFSEWHSSINGSFNVDKNSFSGYIEDNGDKQFYSGTVRENELLNEYSEKIGYVSGGKLYFYYLNGYYPIGK